MSPRWGSTPRLTDWLTVSRNVTLTLTCWAMGADRILFWGELENLLTRLGSSRGLYIKILMGPWTVFKSWTWESFSPIVPDTEWILSLPKCAMSGIVKEVMIFFFDRSNFGGVWSTYVSFHYLPSGSLRIVLRSWHPSPLRMERCKPYRNTQDTTLILHF
jgi:hypothetical protein